MAPAVANFAVMTIGVQTSRTTGQQQIQRRDSSPLSEAGTRNAFGFGQALQAVRPSVGALLMACVAWRPRNNSEAYANKLMARRIFIAWDASKRPSTFEDRSIVRRNFGPQSCR